MVRKRTARTALLVLIAEPLPLPKINQDKAMAKQRLMQASKPQRCHKKLTPQVRKEKAAAKQHLKHLNSKTLAPTERKCRKRLA